MSLNYLSEASLKEFFKAISKWEDGYNQNGFTFVAVKKLDQFVLIQGALWLNTLESKIPFSQFQSENIRAGHYRLSDLKDDPKSFISKILTGVISTPQGDIAFPALPGSFHSLSYTPAHASAQQIRVNVVKLGGAEQFVQMAQPQLDWELRGSENPFDGLNELLVEYGLGGLFSDVITIEVIATAVMGFEETSRVTDSSANVGLRLAKTLDPTKASMGYRVFSQGKVVTRGWIDGSSMQWESQETMQVGIAELSVPLASVVHCYANFDGVTQGHWWVIDPTTSQNARRTVYETFDSGLAVVQEFLTRAPSRGETLGT